MEIDVYAIAIALGVAAGVFAGLFGVGGGVLFVPTLAFGLGLTQLEAEATSLAAILPTVLIGSWRQHRYGNLDHRSSVVLGLAALPGVVAGIAVAASLPEDVLRRLFAVLLVFVAAQIAWRARRATPVRREVPPRRHSGR